MFAESVVQKVSRMIEAGVDFIDLGGYSSRPGADDISVDGEQQRVVPILRALRQSFPDLPISIDTFRSEVARRCLDQGAAMINDISAGYLDVHMLPVIAEYQVPYCMMHMRGTPQTMQMQTQYDDMIQEINYYFSERISYARSLGIHDLLIDPGFGFAKTVSQNFELLQKLEHLQLAELPVLVGLSRKSMIYKTLDTSAEEALNGTTALHMVALQKGASVLRVHDVKEAVECCRLFQALSTTNKSTLA